MTTSDVIRDGETLRVARDGTALRLDKDGNVIADGGRIRVPLVMMDGAPFHRPGPRFADANGLAAKATAHEQMVRELNDAWRHPAPEPTQDSKSPPVVTDAKAVALAERDAQLRDAWRGGTQ